MKSDIGSTVPCGECNACCKSSYFVHIEPHETKALSLIPDKFKLPIYGLPEGNVFLEHDENGHCPMLINDRCSIYEHRPTICRPFDCRVFPAADIHKGEEDKNLVFQRSNLWKFNFPNVSDKREQSAVKSAAKFLKENSDCFPDDFVASNVTQLAMQAIKVYKVFLDFEDKQTDSNSKKFKIRIAKSVLREYENYEKEIGN